jgi:hypothetical protein
LGAGLSFAFGKGLPAFALRAGFFETSFFFATGLAAFALGLALGFAAGLLAFGLATGRLDFFGAAFLRVGRAGFLALAPARFLAAGLRGFVLAGDLRAGFAGFLAMVILEIRALDRPKVGAIGKTSNYIICLSVKAGLIARDIRYLGVP